MPRSQICCRYAPDRGQARSYALRAEAVSYQPHDPLLTLTERRARELARDLPQKVSEPDTSILTGAPKN